MYTLNQTSLVNAKSNKLSMRYQQHQYHFFTYHYSLIYSTIFIPIVSDERLKWGKGEGSSKFLKKKRVEVRRM